MERWQAVRPTASMMDRQSIGAHSASVVLEQLHAEPAERDLRDAQGRFSYRSMGLDTAQRSIKRRHVHQPAPLLHPR